MIDFEQFFSPIDFSLFLTAATYNQECINQVTGLGLHVSSSSSVPQVIS